MSYNLRRVSQAPHSRHDPKNVIGNSKDLHASIAAVEGVPVEFKLKGCGVDTAEIQRTGRLVLFRAKSEGIAVDSGGRNILVSGERHDDVEVLALTILETVVTVELELTGYDGILSGIE